MDTLRTNAGIRPATETTDGKIAVRVPLIDSRARRSLHRSFERNGVATDGWPTGGFRFPS